MKKEINKLESSVEQYTTEAKKIWKALLPAVEKLEKVFETLPGFYSYVSSNSAFSIRTHGTEISLCVNDRPFPHHEEFIGHGSSLSGFQYTIGAEEYYSSGQFCFIGISDLKYMAKYLSSFLLELCQYYTDKAQSLKEVREKYLK